MSKTQTKPQKTKSAVSKAKEPVYRQLIEAAKAASELAYRPYSKYNVGAAVLTFDGKIYSGCNVENCGYTQTKHAEEVAVCNAIANGALKDAEAAGLSQFDFIVAIAVYAPKGNDPWPCCNCRQFLNEWGVEMDVIGEGGRGRILCKKLSKLIPNAFPMEEVMASINGMPKPSLKDIARARAKAKAVTGKLFKGDNKTKGKSKKQPKVKAKIKALPKKFKGDKH
jgi:cytidine deaminase